MTELKITKGLNADIRQIRQDVFVEEQGFVNEFDKIDAVAGHAVAYVDGCAVATGRFFATDTLPPVFHIGRIAVQKPYRNQRLGSKIVLALEQQARKAGAVSVELSAQMQAKPFYEKLGYKPQGKTYLDEHLPHIRMVKTLCT